MEIEQQRVERGVTVVQRRARLASVRARLTR